MAMAKVREFLRFLRLGAGVYKGSGGEVSTGENFGKALAALAGCREFHNYVEIGTAHGLGSTKRIADVLLARPDDCRLWTVEAFRFAHAVAARNWRDVDLRGRVVFVHGTVAAAAMMTYDEVCADANYQPSEHVYSFASWEKNKLAVDSAPDALPHLPKEIDVLILDGGEFGSYGEYRALESRAKVICLDDSVTAIKNRRVREELIASGEWVLAAEKATERNGWSVFCRREWQDTVTPILGFVAKGE